ncbi:hypothetical protein A2276_00235 [candidate division WOR-1 bacterium RIFOXYA12_FULL_43_27]|uniref:Excinuclease ABC subunit C n=1 Tax=candidate division WOR-1 bacterium RIFOXYC2_FULL_46_14 TaxID=1802587 RepID=A0A1F4U4A0_UNCSA|nr:MAG: hypothetical protein A2276_00235 [candidate division WOR-1 bacterium RIFOXYA12_FULL_43_27]OGC20874.1 MAG: hypothetical protein A2292_07640 [candidate division WOR-1 bacterium RIFOXYB2_FULL_46_45]OGC31388.1 MAG: hypothetical protein A2232_03805 [candidate division WOR-1 bacterium RIFOXYA2_FULL_46_56]OGC39794.1 MAG: hypothetical protein A2438_04640 [candidate division WOR-1 bacterium RIFOXYC2_FULL_46_14]
MRFPDAPGVYLFKDKAGTVIYVGKAKSLKKRVASYFSKPAIDPKVARLLEQYKTIEYRTAKNELAAFLLERELIKKHAPRFNIQYSDDKQYPYIKLTINEEWPRLTVVRKKEDDGAEYFGPFEARAVKETLRQVKRIFPIRWCKKFRKRKQPCLYYHLKQCLSPCTGKINRRAYLNLCKAVSSYLGGDINRTILRLEAEMRRASAEKNFEYAAKIRDRIKNLNRFMQGVKRNELTDPYLAVTALQEALSLAVPPDRIEAFDISNIMGEAIVASMVAFERGMPKKSDYRRFKIRRLKGKANDVLAINEVVSRRYTGTLKDKLPKPNLVLIDGGIAQVNSAKSALNAAGLSGLPVIGLAKREEELFWPGKNVPLKLRKDSSALQLLQRLRDEAHRFAVGYHRIVRGKKEIIF